MVDLLLGSVGEFLEGEGFGVEVVGFDSFPVASSVPFLLVSDQSHWWVCDVFIDDCGSVVRVVGSRRRGEVCLDIGDPRFFELLLGVVYGCC